MNSYRRILCVDDDEDSCEMMSLMIQGANKHHFVTTATNGNDAMSLVSKEPFDLYILDFRLPEVSGIELCRFIRQTDSKTPIVFFTGMVREIDGKNAIEAGATKFLVKPNDLDILTTTIDQLLG